MSRLLALCALVLVAGLTGCGAAGSGPSLAPLETGPQRGGFPAGRDSLFELRAGVPGGPVLAPTVTVLERGPNRVGFVLYDRDRQEVVPDAVALYVARPGGRRLRGPFLARRESLRVPPRFASRQTRETLEQVEGFWVAEVPFARRGPHLLTALVRSDDGETQTTNQLELRVGERGGPPDVGERAVRVPTGATPGGRVPPVPALHRADLARVLGRRPVVLSFASPGRCAAGLCAPTLDAAVQVQATTGITTIHQEVLRPAPRGARLRLQALAWGLPSELWTFVIGADGRVRERFEGALSVRELRRAVARLRR